MKKFRLLLAISLLSVSGTVCASVTINLDYTYDTNSFFGSAGSAQRASLEAARNFYQDTVNQSFNAITPGTVYNAGTEFEFSDTWTATFTNPGSGAGVSIDDMIMAEDTITIFVGGRPLSGSTLGSAGRGGFSSSGISSFNNSVTRGASASKYALWGGSAAFDNATIWNFSVASGPSGAENDFLSVALHELGHVLGLSASSDAWNSHWAAGSDTVADASPGTNGQFSGANALAAYNSDNGFTNTFVPTVAAMLDDPATAMVNELDLTNRHFAQGTNSFIYGTTTLQEVAMDPNITTGTRKLLTNVDVGALADIGWQINPISVPEPSSLALFGIAFVAFSIRRRRV